MIIEILTLCDAAAKDARGRLGIFGSVHEIFIPQATQLSWPLAVAARVEFITDEIGVQNLSIYVTDGGNFNFVLLRAQINVQVQDFGGQPTAAYTLVSGVETIPFPGSGRYFLALSSNGQPPVAAFPIYVRVAPPSAWSV